MQAAYKLSLPPLTEASADTIAVDRMRAAQAGFGFVPNMYGVMANSPGLATPAIVTRRPMMKKKVGDKVSNVRLTAMDGSVFDLLSLKGRPVLFPLCLVSVL